MKTGRSSGDPAESGPARLAERARIVLACAYGKDNKAVAAELRTTEHTVARWRGGFTRKRLHGLADEERPGRPPSVLMDKAEEVLIAPLEELPRDATHWLRGSMARRSGLSKSKWHCPIGSLSGEFGAPQYFNLCDKSC